MFRLLTSFPLPPTPCHPAAPMEGWWPRGALRLCVCVCRCVGVSVCIRAPARVCVTFANWQFGRGRPWPWPLSRSHSNGTAPDRLTLIPIPGWVDAIHVDWIRVGMGLGGGRGWQGVAGGGWRRPGAAGGGVGATRSRDLPPYDNLKWYNVFTGSGVIHHRSTFFFC